jgi:hypothetical protein
MSDFSNQYKLAEQSGVGKKEWNKVVNYAATAVAECIKQKYLSLEIITTSHYGYAMQEAFKIYYGKNLAGLVDQTFTNNAIKQMLLYLKRKKQEADELKRKRGEIGEYGIKIMNRLSAMTDNDTDAYNEKVVPDFERMMVPYKDYKYKDLPSIDREFVTSVDIKTLLKNKFQKNSKVKKSDADINDILTTTQNLLNRTGNPQLTLRSLANTAPNDPIFNDIVDTTEKQSEHEIEEAEDENMNIDSLFNQGSSSSSSGSGAGFAVVPKKRRLNDDEDEEPNNNLSSMSSGMPPPNSQSSLTNLYNGLNNEIPV